MKDNLVNDDIEKKKRRRPKKQYETKKVKM